MTTAVRNYFNHYVSAAPLAVFRILFGLMMSYGMLRFWLNGWIEKLYLEPGFHFTYFGFSWVKPLGAFTYVIFLICGVSAFLMALGWRYRWAALIFFLSFTYIELMDKTTYLNHYYFISLVAFLMIFLPAHARFSLDNVRWGYSYQEIPAWSVDAIKLMLGIVYFYAGLAKINSDWLFEAMPLKLWLTSNYDLPLIGSGWMQSPWFHFAMSWAGMLYDLSIPFLLLYRPTRTFAFVMVVFFHVFTRILFPIGMFPFIMIASTTIFFDPRWHERCIISLKRLWSVPEVFGIKPLPSVEIRERFGLAADPWITRGLIAFFTLQVLLPFRHYLYPGELFWTEEGFRFSWRVMLMDKVGYASFKVVDGETGKYFLVNNADFLSDFQEKQMSFQPDFILEYAHYLGDHFSAQGHQNVEIYVDSYVALNGRQHQRFVDPEVNLYEESESFKHKPWILPFNDEIKGL